MSVTMPDMIANRKVIVCAGSGGVGKTTTATAVALAAARQGRRVLALTVDPSKRLAQTLGVSRNLRTPTSIPEERLREAGIEPPATLDAWMLDPGIVADDFVRKIADTPVEAERLTNNRIYRQITRMIAGMQEYMAMEALAGFMREGRYDLIVLDTPPSRNALDFLYGPSRLASFLDGRIFQLFLPGEQRSFLRRAASRLVNGVNTAVFGADNYAELQDFFSSFGDVFQAMKRNAQEGLDNLRDPDEVAFLLVTSPAATAMADAYFFRRKTNELRLPFRGYVLNRSQARADCVHPTLEMFGSNPSAVQRSALEKLEGLAKLEEAAVERDRSLLNQLADSAGIHASAVALPNLPGGADDLHELLYLSDVLAGAA